MTDAARTVLIPGPGHPITIEPTPDRVVVRAAGQVLAETTRALTLREGNYPPVQYVPVLDVHASFLRETATTSYCPYKGDASYFSVITPQGELVDAAWAYKSPYDAVHQIGGHIAFYGDRVEITLDEAVR
jgi:uncharacterized protein (DUF427 family)